MSITLVICPIGALRAVSVKADWLDWHQVGSTSQDSGENKKDGQRNGDSSVGSPPLS